MVLLTAVAAVLYGLSIREAELTVPYEGVGYYLGIAGGSGMLLQLGYAFAKRLRAFHRTATSRTLLRLHMVLGLAAPVAILYHCNFSLGAINSNVALTLMLLVVTSGVTGRIAHRAVLAGLAGVPTRSQAEQVRAEILHRIIQSDAGGIGWKLAQQLSAIPLLASGGEPSTLNQLVSVLRMSSGSGYARLGLQRSVRRELALEAVRRDWSKAEQRQQSGIAIQYVSQFLVATYGRPRLTLVERGLSLWYLLHAPLFYLLIGSGVIHVLYVHWY